MGELGLQITGATVVHYYLYAAIVGCVFMLVGFAAAIAGTIYYFQRFGRGASDVYIQLLDPEPYDHRRPARSPAEPPSNKSSSAPRRAA